jgi:PmbA protein
MSRQEPIALARFGIKAAKGAGAQDARVHVTREREVSAEWRDGKVDRIRESTSQNLSISLFVNQRYSSNTTSDLREAALERFIADCVDLTRHLAQDPHRHLPDPSRYQDMTTADLELFDSSVAEISAEQRLADAAALEVAVREHGQSMTINSADSSAGDTTTNTVCVTSNGFEGEGQERTRLVRYVGLSVDAGDGRKPQSWSYGVRRFVDALPSIDAMGKEAARRAAEQIGSRPVSTGRYEVIIENRSVPRIARFLIQAMRGSQVQQKRSFLEGRIGEQIAVEWLDLTSDPHVPRGLGSAPWDNEGMATRRMPVIEHGVLKNLFLDTYYASKLEMEPTSANQGNLVWSTGDRGVEAMLSEVERGIVVTSFLGGNSNSTTGDFSLGVKGLLVEKGHVVHPVSEVNMAGNHLEFWKQLVEVGDDPWVSSSYRTPSLRFRDVQISGS